MLSVCDSGPGIAEARSGQGVPEILSRRRQSLECWQRTGVKSGQRGYPAPRRPGSPSPTTTPAFVSNLFSRRPKTEQFAMHLITGFGAD